VNEEFVKPTVDAILEAAKSDGGHVGDSRIFVLDLLDCYRVRTGQTGPEAIGP